MSIPHLSAFFSCSFRSDDADLNNYVRSICEALSITCKNVSDGYSETPPEKARALIHDLAALIAVIPKRDQISTDKWTVPSAVHEEISMAYALKKPILLIIERGVSRDGFMSNLSTYIEFDRNNLRTDELTKKLITSFHELRWNALGNTGIIPEGDSMGYYASSVSTLIEPEIQSGGDKKWNYSCVRDLVFTHQFSGKIQNSAWIPNLPDGCNETIEHETHVSSGRQSLIPTTTIVTDTPKQLVIAIDFNEPPQKEDKLSVAHTYKSKHFNALSSEDLSRFPPVGIGDGQTFDCMDGWIPIQPTREMHLRVSFPEWYQVDKESIYPFVGSYSGGIDYLVESEMKRCKIEIKSVGRKVEVDIYADSPLMRHVYGVAWNMLKAN